MLTEAAFDTKHLSESVFSEATRSSVAHRFSGPAPDVDALQHHLETLQLVDLALACACRVRDEQAWDLLSWSPPSASTVSKRRGTFTTDC